MDNYTHSASIGIFRKEIEMEHRSKPPVPNSIFEAAQRVMKSKACEIVRTADIIYIVEYRETGPFTVKTNDEWLPVYVAQVTQWTSGGIKQSEIDAYLHSE